MAAQTMRTFFNSKIKILLLILILTLIWRQRQYVHGMAAAVDVATKAKADVNVGVSVGVDVDAANDDDDDADVSTEEIGSQPEAAATATATASASSNKNLHSFKLTSFSSPSSSLSSITTAADAAFSFAALHNNMTAHNPTGLSKDNERVDDDDVAATAVAVVDEQRVVRMAKDQLGGINKTLSIVKLKPKESVTANVDVVNAFKEFYIDSSTSVHSDSNGSNSNNINGNSKISSHINGGSSIFKSSKFNVTHFQPFYLHPDGGTLPKSPTVEAAANENSFIKSKNKRIMKSGNVEDQQKNENNNKKMAAIPAMGNVKATILKSAKILKKATHQQQKATFQLPKDVDDEYDDDDDGNGNGDGNNNDDDAIVDMTAIFVEQLIYEFAMKYKQIPRLTYFTCHRAATKAQKNKRKYNKNNNSDDDEEKNKKMAHNNGDNDMADDDNNEEEQKRRRTRSRSRRTSVSSFKMKTIKMLKRMFATTSATAASTAAPTSSIAAVESSSTSSSSLLLPTTTKGVSSSNVNKNKNPNGNGNANGDDDDDVASSGNGKTNDNDNDNSSNTTNFNSYGENIGVQQPFRYQVTQRNETMTSADDDDSAAAASTSTTATSSSSASASSSSTSAEWKKSFLIKVMQIDQLINEECAIQQQQQQHKQQQQQKKQRKSLKQHQQQQRECSPLLQRSTRSNKTKTNHLNDNIPNIDTGRRPNSTINWLEAVLRPNKLRQIVVLDLSCGAASRRLIEMASSRALFSSAYHWLLIEDYAFNRQTDNDNGNNENISNDDDVNDNNSSKRNKRMKRNGQIQKQGKRHSNGNGNGNNDNNIKNNACNDDNNNDNDIDNINIDDSKYNNNGKKVANKIQRTTMETNTSWSSSKSSSSRRGSPSIDSSAKLSLNNIENVVTIGNQNKKQCTTTNLCDDTKVVDVDYSSKGSSISSISRSSVSLENMAAIRSDITNNNKNDSKDDDVKDDEKDDDNDDMEIIEKFLEKINININTELILAKRMQGETMMKTTTMTRKRRFGSNHDGSDDIDTKTNTTTATANAATTTTVFDGINSSSNDKSNKPLQSKDYYRLYDVWNPGLHYGGQLNISEIGQFTFDDGLQIAPEYRRSSTIFRRINMKQARIRSIIVITNQNRTDSLEHYLHTYEDAHIDSMSRFQFQLLRLVRDLFNFSLITTQTSSWGYLRNGKYDGMVGAVLRKQADICGSPLFFRLERAKVIDYTARTWETRACFIFRHPRNQKTDRIVFLQPFEESIWILLTVCGICTILILWFLTIMEKKYISTQKKAEKANSEVQLWQIVNNNTNHTNKRTFSAIIRRNRFSNAVYKIFELKTSKEKATIMKNLKPQTKGMSSAKKCKSSPYRQQRSELRRRRRQRRDSEWSNNGQNICGEDRVMVDYEQQQQQQQSQLNKKQTPRKKQYLFLLLDSLVFYIGSISQQGLAFSTSFVSGRCVVITSLFFSFAIFQFYSASVVGTLLMERPKTIRTIPDLTRSSFDIGIEDILYNRDFFRRTKDRDVMDLYAKKMINAEEDEKNNNNNNEEKEASNDSKGSHGTKGKVTAAGAPTAPPSPKEQAKMYRNMLHSHTTGAHSAPIARTNWFEPMVGIKKMQKGKFAFHVDVTTAYKVINEIFTEREICELTEIPLFSTQKTVGCVQKGSPLRKMITYGLRRSIEVGLMDYYRKIYLSPKPRCNKQIHTEDLQVEMETIKSALDLLAFGFLLGIICLFFEILLNRFYNH